MTKRDHPVVKHVNTIQDQIIRLSLGISSALKQVKRTYHRLDPGTKKKIALAIAGMGTVLAAAAAYRRARGKKKG